MKMVKLLGALFALAIGCMAQTQPATFTMTATTSPCAIIRASNNSVVGIIVTGTFSGTLSPTLKIYGATTGVPKKVTPIDGSAQSTILGSGGTSQGFTAAVGGFTEFDLCPTTFVSGTATVQIYATPAVNVGLLGTGTGGAGTVTSVGFSVNGGTPCGAIAVTGSPVSTSGTLNINFTGVNGDILTFNSSNCPADSNTQISSLAAKSNRSISFQFGSPGGSAITTGILGYITVPFGCSIAGWSIEVDAGTATIKTLKIAAGTAIPTITNSISTSGVSISTGTVIQSTTLTDFTSTTVTTNDIIAADLITTSGVGYINFQLSCL